jgi:hypothetical protein
VAAVQHERPASGGAAARRAIVVVTAGAALLAAAAASVAFGAVDVPVSDIWEALTGRPRRAR